MEMNSTQLPQDHLVEQFISACQSAAEYVRISRPEHQAEAALDQAKELLGLAHQVAGVACSECRGTGAKTYGDTGTWRKRSGMIAGAALTSDTCDRCWGTGRADKTGVNLAELAHE